MGVRGGTSVAALVLHELELLLLLRLLVFLHQAAQEILIVTRCLGNIGRASRGRVELLGIMGSSVARITSELGEIAAETGATRRPDLDRVSCLMRLPRVWRSCRRVLHGGLVRGLRLFGCFRDIKVVLILPSGIRVLGRVQDLLLALELLLQHYLRLLLVGTRAAVLQGLRVATHAALAVSFVDCSRSAAIVL